MAESKIVGEFKSPGAGDDYKFLLIEKCHVANARHAEPCPHTIEQSSPAAGVGPYHVVPLAIRVTHEAGNVFSNICYGCVRDAVASLRKEG